MWKLVISTNGEHWNISANKLLKFSDYIDYKFIAYQSRTLIICRVIGGLEGLAQLGVNPSCKVLPDIEFVIRENYFWPKLQRVVCNIANHKNYGQEIASDFMLGE